MLNHFHLFEEKEIILDHHLIYAYHTKNKCQSTLY